MLPCFLFRSPYVNLKSRIHYASRACNVTNSCSWDGRANALQSAREALAPIGLVSVFTANTKTFLSSIWDVVLTTCVVRAAYTLGEPSV
jgi:hypothetical protein